jgi:hypothetical protein
VQCCTQYSVVSMGARWCWYVQEDAQEEFGWKLVHGDVFRPPRKGMLLSLLLGSGVQIFFMTMITLGKFLLCSLNQFLCCVK